MTIKLLTSDLTIREIGRDDWPLISELFGARGACGGCWCMHWRIAQGGKMWEAAKGEPNRLAFKELVQSGQARGIIALHNQQPMGWCSFGLRTAFPRLERTKAYRQTEPANRGDVWSINCLFINKEGRGQRLSIQLVQAAVEAIGRLNGTLIEAYPVTLTKDGQKLPPAFSFTGPEIIYQRLGFKETERRAQSRPLYCLELK